MILAIDFDNTIHDINHPVPNRKMGPPISLAKESLTKFKQQGHEIIIFTVWGGTIQGQTTIKKWMDYYEIPFDTITNIKPNADHFIDDRAIHFTSWSNINL